MKILIVDDEPLIRSSLRLYIEKQGIPSGCILEAGSAAQLQAALEAEPIDVAFVDVRMPGMDGLEAIRRCKGIRPDVSFYIISGFSDFSYAQRAIRLHVTDYLLKPISPEAVHEVILRETARLSPHSDSDEAAAPTQDESEDLQGKETDALTAVRRFIRERYAEDITVSRLASAFHLTPNYLSSVFKKKYGVGLISYLTEVRMAQARRLLETTERPVQEIAAACGYDDAAYFSKVFMKSTGYAPAKYRKKHS